MAAKKLTSVPKSNTNDLYSNRLMSHLQNYYIKKGNDGPVLEKTNTRIKSAELSISGGTYHIPDEEYYNFLKIYYEEIIVKGATEYLTEKQLDRGGPILIDIDFRYDSTKIKSRQHTKDHIVDLICLYLDELKTMFQFEESKNIPIFILEKPNVNSIEKADKNITKDGIHIMIGLQADRVVQQILRQRIIQKIPEIWEDIPITNTWENAVDESVTKGHANWQLTGSKKPGGEAYNLTYVFHVSLDPSDKELVMPEIEKDVYLKNFDNFKKMSARYREHVSFFMESNFIEEYNQICNQLGFRDNGNKKPLVSSSSIMSMSNTIMTSTNMLQNDGINPGYIIGNILNIRNKNELDALVSLFLDSLTMNEYEYREVYEYTMALPKTYYSSGSFDKWIRVGWALRNISKQLFIIWVAFSAQADDFSYTSIRDDLWQRWSSFDIRADHGLTKRSIMYWVKEENPDAYKRILENSVDKVIDNTLEQCIQSSDGDSKRRIKGSGDYDIAVVLHHLYRDEYKCVSIKANIWYRFCNHRWKEIDSGTTLRKEISNTLRDKYVNKQSGILRQLVHIRSNMQQQENEEIANKKIEGLKKRMDAIQDIIKRLSQTNDKKNIMTEAKELFFDADFLQKLDQNPYLLCFQNGVIDFKEKKFRRGLPEDYISKCTNINYVTVDPGKHGTIIEEIHDFMRKLFPNPELHKYMWEHLASTLIGNNMNQTFNMYIGIGQNGKSVLVNLMEHVLGDYKGDVPLTLITQQRTRIGGLSPEVVKLNGVRYAVMQEPSKGDRINEGVMKQITGGDPIQARAPYMPQMVTFTPQFKLVVCLNVFMELYSQDHGTRRRIRVVEFESLFTENPVQGDPDKPYQYKLDKTIKEKFDYWKEVFASMLVDKVYETNGNVQDCNKVMAASTSYLDRQDFVGEFITEMIEVCETGTLMKQQLAFEFKEWYSNNFSGRPPNIRDVADVIDKRFGKIDCGVWRGIRLKQKTSIHSAMNDDGSINTSSTHRAEESNGIDEFASIQEI